MTKTFNIPKADIIELSRSPLRNGAGSPLSGVVVGGVRRVALLATLALLGSGCLARQLRGPAAEHHAQLAMLVESCEAFGWGERLCTAELMRLQVMKACLIESIASGEDGEACSDG